MQNLPRANRKATSGLINFVSSATIRRKIFCDVLFNYIILIKKCALVVEKNKKKKGLKLLPLDPKVSIRPFFCASSFVKCGKIIARKKKPFSNKVNEKWIEFFLMGNQFSESSIDVLHQNQRLPDLITQDKTWSIAFNSTMNAEHKYYGYHISLLLICINCTVPLAAVLQHY